DALRHAAQIEYFWCFNRGQFLPLERRGDRCAWKSAHAVSRHNRLRGPVAINVQQNLALAMLFLDLQGQRGTGCVHKRLRKSLGGFKRVIESPIGFNRRHDVETLAAGGLDEGMIPKTFKVLFEFQGEVRNVWKFKGFRRVEIVDDIIRFVEMGGPRMHLM